MARKTKTAEDRGNAAHILDAAISNAASSEHPPAARAFRTLLIRTLGMMPTKHADVYQKANVRVAIYPDDDRAELYAFAGDPGRAAIAYEVSISFGMPLPVAEAFIRAAIANR